MLVFLCHVKEGPTQTLGLHNLRLKRHVFVGHVTSRHRVFGDGADVPTRLQRESACNTRPVRRATRCLKTVSEDGPGGCVPPRGAWKKQE